MLNALHPGKIQETTKATQAEAVAGADNRKYMTPLRTKQVVDVVVDDVVEEALPSAINTAIAASGAIFDDVLSVETLPTPGVAGKLYIVGKLSYHWNGTDYDQLGVDDTDDLSEGTENLYFTEARASAAVATDISTAVSAEATARAAADASLAGGLNDLISGLQSEVTARAAADASLAGGLQSETTARQNADTALSQRIDYLASNLDPEALDSVAEAAASINGLTDSLAAESQARAAADTALHTALDGKQSVRTTESFVLQEGDNHLPAGRNTLYLLSGSFTLARIFLPVYLPDGTGPWIGDRIRIVWVGVKANANSRIVVNAFAGNGQFPALAHLHEQDQTAEFVLDNRPVNNSGQLTWRSDVSPIRWVQPPATPNSFLAPNGGVYSPSDVAFDGAYFYIYGKKSDGSPVWLRTPMASTW